MKQSNNIYWLANRLTAYGFGFSPFLKQLSSGRVTPDQPGLQLSTENVTSRSYGVIESQVDRKTIQILTVAVNNSTRTAASCDLKSQQLVSTIGTALKGEI